MQQDAENWVEACSMNNELGQPAVVFGFIPQGLYQLEQVVPQFLIVCPLQSFHSKAAHLQVRLSAGRFAEATEQSM